MKKPSVYSIFIACVLAAFFAGRASKSGTEAETSNGTPTRLTAPKRVSPEPSERTSRQVTSKDKTPKRPLYSEGAIPEEEARKLTPEQRLALIRQGSLIFDGLRQTEFLAGVIPALSYVELTSAIEIMGDAQGRGNFAAQAVWDALWRQSGRIDPIGCLAGMNANPNGKSRSDARHVMEGWYETDPDAARAWAQQAGKTGIDAQAAAAVISWTSAGDIDKMRSALEALPPGDAVRKDVMQDYFDLSAAGGQGEAASAYDKLPQELKKDGWAAALQQISFGDSQTAVDWLAKHAGEPGTDYGIAANLIREITKEDPAAATAWVATLPEIPSQGEGTSFHPALLSFGQWRRADPTAASAWLANQQTNANWVKELRARFPQ